jgi:putative phage-type endonuclease
MEQRTQEWYSARMGKVTASAVCNVLAKLKTGKEAQARADYRMQLVAERLTGLPADKYQTPAMAWGVENEADARFMYEELSGNMVTEVGFIDHPTVDFSGASPDGLVGDDGLIEIKCPNTKTHIETLLAKECPEKHMPQIQWQLACTGRQWCDFVSFDPRMPEGLEMFVCRVARDDEYISMLEAEITAFLAEIQQIIEKLGV